MRVGDNEALVFTMRELNQQTPRLIKEIQKTGNPAVITRHGRFVVTIAALAAGQVESEVMPVIARHVAKESPVVRVGDDEALIYTMRELNQQTARVIEEMGKGWQACDHHQAWPVRRYYQAAGGRRSNHGCCPRWHARSQNETRARPRAGAGGMPALVHRAALRVFSEVIRQRQRGGRHVRRSARRTLT